MDFLLGLLAVAWIILPAVFIPLFIMRSAKNNKLMDENKRLKNFIGFLWGAGRISSFEVNSLTPDELHQKDNPAQKKAFDEEFNIGKQAVQRNENPQPYVKNPQSRGVNIQKPCPPQQKVQSPVYNMPDMNRMGNEFNSKPQKEYNKTTAKIMLIIGVIFIILSGLIFATTTWFILPDAIKILSIAVIAAVFFITSEIAERKMQLIGTGQAMFVLGAAFLPIGIIAGGFNGMFEFMNLSDRAYTHVILMFACIALMTTMGIGAVKYSQKWMAYTSFASLTGTVCSLTLACTDDMQVFSICIALYSLIFSLAGALIKPENVSDKFKVLTDSINGFIMVNTSVLGIVALFSAGMGTLSFGSAMLFAIIFLRNSFKAENKGEGVYPFALFMLIALFKLISPESTSSFMFIAVASTVTLSLIGMLGIFGDGAKKAFSLATKIFTIASFVFASIACLWSGVWDTFSEVTFGLLIANTIWLCFREKDGRYALASISVPLLIIFFVQLFSNDLIVESFGNSGKSIASLLLSICILALFIIFRLPKLYKLHTIVSDILFPLTVFMASTWDYTYRSYSPWISIAEIIMAISMVGIVAFANNDTIKTKIYRWVFAFSISSLYYPIMQLFNPMYMKNSSYSVYMDKRIISMYIVYIVTFITALTLLILAFNGKEKMKKFILPFDVATLYLAIQTFAYDNLYLSVMYISCIYSLARLFIRKDEKGGHWLYIAAISLLIGLFTSSADMYSNGFKILDADFDKYILPSFVALLYFAFSFALNKLKVNFRYNKQLENIGIISQVLTVVISYLSCIFSPYCCKDLSRAERISISWTCFVIFVLFSIMAYISIHLKSGKKNNIAAFVPLGAFCLAVIEFSEDMLAFCSLNVEYLALIALGFYAVFAVLGRIFYKKSLDTENGITVDLLTWATLFWSLIILGYSDNYADLPYGDGLFFIGWLALAGVFALQFKRMNTVGANRAMLTITSFFALIALWNQPFFEYPDVISLELNLLPVILFCWAIKTIWKNALNVINNINFAIACLSFFVMLADALDGGYVADAVIIGVGGLVTLIISFFIKKLRWFALGVSLIAFLGIYMSMRFWTNVAWWVYLLVAGIALIGFASANEVQKRKGISIKEKISESWKW